MGRTITGKFICLNYTCLPAPMSSNIFLIKDDIMNVLTKIELFKINMRVEEIIQTIEITDDADILDNLDAELDEILLQLNESLYNLKRQHLKVL